MRNTIIFFDIGGTLLESPDIFEVITRRLVGRWPDEPTYNLVLKTYMEIIEPMQKDKAEQPFKSIVDLHSSSLKYLASRYGYTDISALARDICVDVYVHRSSYFPEVGDVLGQLRENRVKMIIASDNDSVGFNIQVPKFGLDRYFSDYCISETARAYKPTYGFINSLKKFLPDSIEECYFVGDSWVDVESGKRLGVKSVLIDRKLDSKVSGADYTIQSLRDLLPILNLK